MHSCALFGHSAVQTVLRLNTKMLSCVTKHRNGDSQEYVLKTSSKRGYTVLVNQETHRKCKARYMTKVHKGKVLRLTFAHANILRLRCLSIPNDILIEHCLKRFTSPT